MPHAIGMSLGEAIQTPMEQIYLTELDRVGEITKPMEMLDGKVDHKTEITSRRVEVTIDPGIQLQEPVTHQGITETFGEKIITETNRGEIIIIQITEITHDAKTGGIPISSRDI